MIYNRYCRNVIIRGEIIIAQLLGQSDKPRHMRNGLSFYRKVIYWYLQVQAANILDHSDTDWAAGNYTGNISTTNYYNHHSSRIFLPDVNYHIHNSEGEKWSRWCNIFLPTSSPTDRQTWLTDTSSAGRTFYLAFFSGIKYQISLRWLLEYFLSFN